jgi:hypothetical protein
MVPFARLREDFKRAEAGAARQRHVVAEVERLYNSRRR